SGRRQPAASHPAAARALVLGGEEVEPARRRRAAFQQLAVGGGDLGGAASLAQARAHPGGEALQHTRGGERAGGTHQPVAPVRAGLHLGPPPAREAHGLPDRAACDCELGRQRRAGHELRRALLGGAGGGQPLQHLHGQRHAAPCASGTSASMQRTLPPPSCSITGMSATSGSHSARRSCASCVSSSAAAARADITRCRVPSGEGTSSMLPAKENCCSPPSASTTRPEACSRTTGASRWSRSTHSSPTPAMSVPIHLTTLVW